MYTFFGTPYIRGSHGGKFVNLIARVCVCARVRVHTHSHVHTHIQRERETSGKIVNVEKIMLRHLKCAIVDPSP